MRNYILSKDGNDYKANMHCHTTISDGEMTPAEVKDYYMSNGYSIVAFTDHELFVPHPELCDENFCALNAYEMSIYDYNTTTEYLILRMTHLNFVALDPKLDTQPFFHRERYFIGNGVKNKHLIKFDETKPDFVREYTPESVNMVMRECKKLGFFVTYNHPRWSLENYSVYSKYDEMNGLELMNGGSMVEGYIEHNQQVFDDLLSQGKKVFAIAGDDNHGTWDTLVCWTVIRSKDLSYESVANALKNGDFYATNGPEIKEYYEEDGYIYVTTSDVKNIIFTTNTRNRLNVFDNEGKTVNSGKFKIGQYDKYVRITAVAKDGTVAYSNPYFIK